MKNYLAPLAVCTLLIIAILLSWIPSPGILLPEQSPHGREEWRSMMRGGNVSPEKVLGARKFLEKRSKQNSYHKDAGINGWQELGPGNFSGRTRAIAVHPTNPNTIFLGGASGGIWKTTNGGASWQHVDDFLPSLAVTSIIIHPTNPQIMYVSTGEGIPLAPHIPGAGILKSTNGGVTWNTVSAIDQSNIHFFYWVNKLVFDPSNPTIFYASTGGGANQSNPFGCGDIYKFSNNGSTFTDLNANSPCHSAGIDIDIDPNNTNKIYAGFEAGMTMSINGGLTWTNMNGTGGFSSNPGRVEISIAPSNSNIIYASVQDPANNGNLYKSINGGTNWTNMTNNSYNYFTGGSGNNQGGYDNTIWVDPLDEDNVIIGGVDLWRSTNGGSTFTRISDWTEYKNGNSPHADHHVIVEASNYSAANKRVYFGNDGGIARSNNFLIATSTTGWILMNGTTLGTTQLYNSHSNGNVYIGGAQDNGTMLTRNHGATWTRVAGGDGGYCAIIKAGGAPANDTLLFSTQNGNFYRSDDGGGTFIQIASLNNSFSGGLIPACTPNIIDDNPAFIAPLKLFPDTKQKVLIGGERLWYSENAGCTWSNKTPSTRGIISGTTITAMDIPTGNENIVVIGYSNGEVWLANISGTTWTWTKIAGDIGSLLGSPITDIAVSHKNNSKIVVSTGGYNDFNVWMSFNSGNTWTERSNGIPPLHVSCLVWHPDANTWLYAGTDLGVMASENNGLNWNMTPLSGNSEGPAYTEISELYFLNYRLVATTYGRGIWRSDNSIHKNVYVDKNYNSAVQLGTAFNPFTSFRTGVFNAGNGSTIHIVSTGDHLATPGNLLINERIFIKAVNGSVVIK